MIIKAIVKGMLTFLPGIKFLLDKKTTFHSSYNSKFCYSFWLQLFVALRKEEYTKKLEKVGEIGNGGSLGMGICALLTGSKEYYSFEINKSFDKKKNLKLLDELAELFEEKSKIPSEFEKLNIHSDTYDFPKDLIKNDNFNQNIIEEIRSEINSDFINSKRIKIIQDWESHASLNLDLVFSRAVLEHVNAPIRVYHAVYSHLNNNAIMAHDIELHSHGITQKLDGHYRIPNYLWKIIFGNRSYFLNRWNCKHHIACIEKTGFEICSIFENHNPLLTKNKNEPIGAFIIAKKM